MRAINVGWTSDCPCIASFVTRLAGTGWLAANLKGDSRARFGVQLQQSAQAAEIALYLVAG